MALTHGVALSAGWLWRFLMMNYILIYRFDRLMGKKLGAERRFRHRPVPLYGRTPAEIKQHYRFDPRTILYITRKLHATLRRRTNRSNPIDPLLQVLIALDVLAHGSYAQKVASRYHVGKSSVDRVVKRFCAAVNTCLASEMRWPSEAALRDIKESFYRIANMPGVVGLVDGMLVKIQKPPGRCQDYMCRKNYYAINCVVCAGPDNIIYAANASWPGSVHDTRALEGSGFTQRLMQTQHGHVLGDNGYPLRDWLLTPILRPQNRAEIRYNSAHSRTRVRIEHTFGILKARFAVLSRGPMSKNPATASQMMGTCFILHNIATRQRDHISPLARHSIVDHQRQHLDGVVEGGNGQAKRQEIIQNYFRK